jgi:predicted HD phosphohydrolase
VFAASTEAVTGSLDAEGIDYDVERKRVRKLGEERVFTHIHVRDRFPIELTMYSPDKSSFVFKSSITGKAMERATLAEFEAFLRSEYPDADLDNELAAAEAAIDRFQVYRALLIPLETVMQDEHYHPEGDVLYHSLQCYILARNELPYDEEFQLAALLHDVGKGLDKHNHVQAGLEALEGHITPRTAWLIENHMLVHQIRDRTIGHRAHMRLKAEADYDDLLLLGVCDRGGRVCGAIVPEIDDALDEIRELARMYG